MSCFQDNLYCWKNALIIYNTFYFFSYFDKLKESCDLDIGPVVKILLYTIYLEFCAWLCMFAVIRLTLSFIHVYLCTCPALFTLQIVQYLPVNIELCSSMLFSLP